MLLAFLAAAGVCLPGCGERFGGNKTGIVVEWRNGELVQRSDDAQGAADASAANIRSLFERRSYRQAVDAAKKHVKKFPGDITNEEVYYIAGRSEIARGRYYQAYEQFEKQVKEFPGGVFFERGLTGEQECAEAFLAGKRRIAAGIFRIKAVEEGIMILEGIAEHAPGTRMAEQVLLRVGDFQFSQGKYEEAADSYDRFMALFPKSTQACHVLQRAAECSFNMYRGADYDDTPLLEAKQRYENLAEQFPQRAAELNVDQILEEIRSIRAAKLYDSAEFYERTKHPKAAIRYYEQVREDFPRTEWAYRSQLALARLNGRQLGEPVETVAETRQPVRARPTRGSEIGPVGAGSD